MATFTEQAYYGGAIKGIIPQGWMDSSTFREVPDHQEIFLSPTTLSSQIIELNSRVSPDEALAHSTGSTTTTTPDLAAALYHIHDVCDNEDTLEITQSPYPVTMARMRSVPGVTAYRGEATITSRNSGSDRNRNRDGSVGGAAAGSSTEGALTTLTSCFFLLVRLAAQETDLLVFVNVPRKEFEAARDEAGLEREEELARGIVGAMERK
ncbi:Mog1p/PsbP-like protein [Aspergillus campestris IBT 28561]|uniref:Mog1p/PsbP-like protein n=1 Tax=Aspergillus campestris (strain IBT 28561) TaxID=1392248 RepID=A0A2I1DBX4_ASPC2|nr:Mog1p/PsbP-like protein [Aspergillus campestris IBT 28561]PKY07361.1 Mog1p/PsbP-like protein [Aspergillus campestris IBT 28561]